MQQEKNASAPVGGRHTLEFRGISKTYPGVKALQDVSFTVESGKVLALLGENGAGKSTLLKIMSGDQKPSAGTILYDGEELHLASPHAAIQQGISIIYQERQLIPGMSVMENIFMDEVPTKGGIVDYATLKTETQKLIDKFGIPITPTQPVISLSVAHQQMVEIMKAYRRDAKVIAFDEPTAPLTDTEIDILFRLIEELKQSGKIVMYVSHRMKEIFQITDEIVVLKDGRYVTRFETAGTNEDTLISAMVGRDVGDTYKNLSRNDKYGDVLLELDNVETDAVHGISLQLRAGEVIGLAGLVGAGRTEVARAIFGADEITSGEIRLEGKPLKLRSARDGIRAGIALCPEDRKDQGLVLWHSITNNVCLPVLAKLRKWGVILDPKKEDALTTDAVHRYDIKTPTLDKQVVELSGGNQQKVILGRWTSNLMETKVLILDEPTKGIDVGTKAEIYQMVCDFAKQGIAVIFISSELPEVINVTDKIYVLRNGRITGSLMREEATEEKVLALAMKED
jgi:ABC-type sugar transport system ATPase subunit